jgi:short subunit dehydrogenase-like uncharacterized protein
MPRFSKQSGPIAVYGATGYTGKLVAAELAEAKADFVISGRNEAKLEALAGELGGKRSKIKALVAPLDDPIALRTLLDDCAAVINCAGPFTLYGEPVLEAAVDTETHYLDTTGEQDFIRLALSQYGPEAEKAGVAVIPAMGFDFVPGDMIASLTAEGMGELDELSLNYAWTFAMSRGTALSTLEIMRDPGIEWSEMKWHQAGARLGRGSFDFPPPIGRQRMIRFAAGEQVTVPRHVPTRNVRTNLTASTIAPSALARAVPALGAGMGALLRTPVRRALAAAISRLPEGPKPEQRAKARYTIVCDAVKGVESRRGVISGRDVYGLTAALTARGARIVTGKDFEGRGGLAPSQAFEPREFLADLDDFGLSWEVEGFGGPRIASEPAQAAAAAS